MKKSQSPKVLDLILSEFARRIAFVRFDSYTAQHNLKDPHKALKEALNKDRTLDPKKRISSRGIMAYAYDLRVDDLKESPELIILEKKWAVNQDLLNELVVNFNTQLRWLLVSACESYFLFVKELYGAIGFLDRQFWPCKDYGKIRLAEVNKQNLPWHQERAKNLRAADIFKVFRSSFPNLDKYECPPYIPNPKFWLITIENFRHSIVHAGSVFDVHSLVQKLNNGVNKKDAFSPEKTIGLLSYYCKDVNGQSQIWIIEETSIQKGNYGFIDRPFLTLLENLSSHACLLYSCALEHFGHSPRWERKKK